MAIAATTKKNVSQRLYKLSSYIACKFLNKPIHAVRDALYCSGSYIFIILSTSIPGFLIFKLHIYG